MGDDGTFDKTGECEYEETIIVELGDTELLDERYVIGLLGTWCELGCEAVICKDSDWVWHLNPFYIELDLVKL